MGNCFRKNKYSSAKKPIIINAMKNNNMYVLCDNNGFIIDINNTFTENLHYKLHDLKGQFVGILMNNLLAYLPM